MLKNRKLKRDLIEKQIANEMVNIYHKEITTINFRIRNELLLPEEFHEINDNKEFMQEEINRHMRGE